MGVATAARSPSLPTMAPNGPSASLSPLIRAGHPVCSAAVVIIPGCSFTRKPTGTSSLTKPYEPRTVVYPSSSPRSPDGSMERSTLETNVASAPIRRPSSSATALNTSAGRAPPATSVATRRSAACSSTRARSRVRSGGSLRIGHIALVGAGVRRVHQVDGSPMLGWLTTPGPRSPLLEEQLDDGHGYPRWPYRKRQRERAGRLRSRRRVEGVLAGDRGCQGDLRRIAEELRVLDLVGHFGQVHVPERPGQQVQVEPVAAQGVASVRRRGERGRPGAVHRSRVQRHPLADAGQRLDGVRVEAAASGRPDVE